MPRYQLFWLSVVGLIFAGLLIGQLSALWTICWLVIDGQTDTATIVATKNNSVYYTYNVNGQTHDASIRTKNYLNYQPVGRKVAVYYSASHPWLSLLQKPESALQFALVLIVVFGGWLFLIVRACVTAISGRLKQIDEASPTRFSAD